MWSHQAPSASSASSSAASAEDRPKTSDLTLLPFAKAFDAVAKQLREEPFACERFNRFRDPWV